MSPVYSTNGKTASSKKRRRRIGEFTNETKQLKKSFSTWDKIKLEIQHLTEDSQTNHMFAGI